MGLEGLVCEEELELLDGVCDEELLDCEDEGIEGELLDELDAEGGIGMLLLEGLPELWHDSSPRPILLISSSRGNVVDSFFISSVLPSSILL